MCLSGGRPDLHHRRMEAPGGSSCRQTWLWLSVRFREITKALGTTYGVGAGREEKVEAV